MTEVAAHIGLVAGRLLLWSCKCVRVESLCGTSQHWWPLFVSWRPVHAGVEFGNCMAIASEHNSSLCFIEILEHCKSCIFLHPSSQGSYGVWRCTQLLTLPSAPRRPPSKALPPGVLCGCFPGSGNEIAFSSDAQGRCTPGKWPTEKRV